MKYILMVLMVTVAIGASAQIPRTAKYLPSSEAASLGEFGDYKHPQTVIAGDRLEQITTVFNYNYSR